MVIGKEQKFRLYYNVSEVIHRVLNVIHTNKNCIACICIVGIYV